MERRRADKKIDEEIREAKRLEAERVSYMTYAMKMMEERKEGMKEGIEKGTEKGRLSASQAMMKHFGASMEPAMDVLEIPSLERAYYRSRL